MEWWWVAAAANLIVAVVYVGIAVLIVRPLARQGRLQSNPLATATAPIVVSAALPSVRLDEHVGRATREVFGWPLAVSDLCAAAVGVYYLSLRRTYGMRPGSGELFTDTRRRQQEALAVSLESARGMVDRLLSEVECANPPKPGRFVRREPTRLRRP